MKALLGLWLLVGCIAAAHADDWRKQLKNQEAYPIGIYRYGVDDGTRVIGWQLGDNLYFGRRQGDVKDFGFVLKRGATQYSFTQRGIGWRHSFTLH